MPISRTLNQDFFKVWSPDMAYVLGFFAADGSMVRNNRGAHFIEFNITDRIVLEHIQRVTGSNHALTERKGDSRANPNWKPIYRLQIGSKSWFNDLVVLGLTQNKSKTLIFPPVPPEYLGPFVRGYFDGDGCVYFKQHWSAERERMIWIFLSMFTSGSKSFLESLHTRLKLYGVVGGRISKKERGYDLVFSRNDSLALYRLMYNTGFHTGPYLPRKQLLFVEAITTLYGSNAVRA